MWSQMLMALVGIWLMAAPGVFGFDKAIANNAHVVGPLIATFGIIAAAECTRNVRWASFPLGTWLFIAPWVIGYNDLPAIINDYAVGIATVLLCYIKPQRQHRFGGGWPAAWQSNTLHWRESGNRTAENTRR